MFVEKHVYTKFHLDWKLAEATAEEHRTLGPPHTETLVELVVSPSDSYDGSVYNKG